MKGYREFVSALLPKVTGSARMDFTNGIVKSSVKVMDGNLIIISSLNTDNEIENTIGIPVLGDLDKALRIMGECEVGIETINDTPSKLTLSNEFSKISLFLLDSDFISSPALSSEAPYVTTVNVPVACLNTLKSIYSLIDSELTIFSIENGLLTISVGKKARNDNNSGSVSIPSNCSSDLNVSLKSKTLQSILPTIGDEDVVTLSICEHMVNVSVNTEDDGYKLVTDYYAIPVTE